MHENFGRKCGGKISKRIRDNQKAIKHFHGEAIPKKARADFELLQHK